MVDSTGLLDAKPKQFRRFVGELLGNDAGFVFLYGSDGLQLYAGGELDLHIRADFRSPSVSYRRKQGGGRGQLIARAVGFKANHAPKVLDGTAGLGGDAFVLASLGCQVRMCERVPAVRALLQDGMLQARKRADARCSTGCGAGWHGYLVQADTVAYLKTVCETSAQM